MKWFRKSPDKGSGNTFSWIELTDLATLEQALAEEQAVIFKHSTRCSISSMAKNRLENGSAPLPEMPFYYLDVIAHRDLSNAIESTLGVKHETPQLIVVSRGKAVYHTSHSGISREALLAGVE